MLNIPYFSRRTRTETFAACATYNNELFAYFCFHDLSLRDTTDCRSVKLKNKQYILKFLIK